MSVSRSISERLWHLSSRLSFRAVALPICLVAALLVSSSTRPRAQPPADELPGGAQSLNEQHGDWVVRCAIASGKVHCSLSQSQVRQKDHRRVLSIELAVGATRSDVGGALVLPFGLRLSAGVDLLIDDKALLSAPFSTCLQMGCLVPLKLGAKEVSAMSAGGKLSVTAVIEDSGKPIKLTISLKGFTSALNRTADLIGVQK